MILPLNTFLFDGDFLAGYVCFMTPKGNIFSGSSQNFDKDIHAFCFASRIGCESVHSEANKICQKSVVAGAMVFSVG
jgi:hypothetical protein